VTVTVAVPVVSVEPDAETKAMATPSEIAE
jgi:hypothetical protein